MIDEKVESLGLSFAHSWNSDFQTYRKYLLDFSWPSVGVLDRILFPLRNKNNFSAEEQQILSGSAAYLGLIAHEIWSRFPENPQVKLFFDQKSDIVIQITGTALLGSNEKFLVNISSSLNTLISATPGSYNFYEKCSRKLGKFPNIVTLFATGLFTGLCPSGEGSWATLEDSKSASHLGVFVSCLAETTAAYYRQVFPSEVLAANALLYENHLMLPPLGHREFAPGTRGTHGVLNHLRNKPVTEIEVNNLAWNLAQSPDDLISKVGFSLAAGLLRAPAPRKLRILAESLAEEKLVLREAIDLVRRHLGETASIPEHIRNGNLERALQLIEIDRSLGMIPSLKIPSATLITPKILPLLNFLLANDLSGARDAINHLAQDSIFNAELILQGAFLDISLNDYNSAEQRLSLLKKQGINEANFLALENELHAFCLIKRNDLAAAVHILEETISLKISDLDLYIELVNQAAELHMAAGNIERASELLLPLIQPKVRSLRGALNAFQVFQVKTNEAVDLKELREQLLRIVPFNHFVFQEVMRER